MEHTAGQELFITMVINEWNRQNTQFDKIISGLTDEQLLQEIAPGKNTGIYLLGHLVAISDSMLPLLGFGEKLFPELESVFVKSPDKSGLEQSTVGALKEKLKKVNEKLAANISTMPPATWFTGHAAVSPEDFAKEPHRNKLNIVLNRASHMAYHLGQLRLLK